MDFNNIELFLFDLDGTLYLGNELFDFTKELLNTIKKLGKRYIFITNNSSKSVQSYIEKLANLGIETESGDYVTASTATALYLKENCPKDNLYVVGTNSFKKELESYGLKVTENISEVDCVVLASDTELTFKKLDDACKILSTGNPKYIATNPDDIVPTEYGFIPDCGSLADMIYNATKKRPEFIGKPQPIMPNISMKRANCIPEKTVVIGDRLDTDIESGINAGCKTILVMTGSVSEENLRKSNIKPDIVYNSGKEILDKLKNSLA